MKRLMFIATLFYALTPAAFAHQCAEEIVKLNDWGPLSAKQLSCTLANSQAREALRELCARDDKNFSPKYQKYLAYQAEYERALANLNEELNEAKRTRLLFLVTQAERKWMIAGFQGEIDHHLFTQLNGAVTSCKQ